MLRMAFFFVNNINPIINSGMMVSENRLAVGEGVEPPWSGSSVAWS